MKEKIIEIIDAQIEAYGGGDSDHVGITEKSLQAAAEELTQLMCDAAIHQMWYFGRWPERFILITNMQHAYLLQQGFSEDQIKRAITNQENLK